MWLVGGFLLAQKWVTVLKRKLFLVLGSVNHRCGGKRARLSDVQWLPQRSKCACVKGV